MVSMKSLDERSSIKAKGPIPALCEVRGDEMVEEVEGIYVCKEDVETAFVVESLLAEAGDGMLVGGIGLLECDLEGW